MDDVCALEKDKIWGNIHVRETLLKYRFEEHSSRLSSLCFKKDCECRFLFPFQSNDCTYIHKRQRRQRSEQTLFYSLDESTNKVYPFMVLPKRPMGCQFINAHSHSISAVFNFNTNISIGDVSHVYYTSLYTSKSTQ